MWLGTFGFSYIGLLWLLVAVLLLGGGHIGVHLQHKRTLQ